MAGTTVLISGAGIAGPTLAYWLLRRGFEPVIVERAPMFRTGGYILDFWGVGYEVAERMGLIPALREAGYVNDRAVFVRQDGSVRSSFGGDVLRRVLQDRYLSIQRSDLARTIYETVRDKVETIFGDEIVAVNQHSNCVEVAFKSTRVRAFDLVVGADGLHSGVRELSLRNAAPERYLRYYAAVFVAKGYSKRQEKTYLSYAVAGRQVSRFSLRNDETGFLFAFARKKHDPRFGKDIEDQKRVLQKVFGKEPWAEWPEIEARLMETNDLYFDAVSQIELPTWSNGRIALIGDAAYCPSLLAGEGSAFAMAGAYILAGELARANGDHMQAFKAYEHGFRPFIERKQKSARSLASSFAPMTAFGLQFRDVVLRLASIPVVADLLMQRLVSDRYELPIYED